MTVPSYENPPAQFIYESSTIIFLLFKCVNKTNNIKENNNIENSNITAIYHKLLLSKKKLYTRI